MNSLFAEAPPQSWWQRNKAKVFGLTIVAAVIVVVIVKTAH